MQLVAQPIFFPTACVCGNQTGPMVDTGIETGAGRVYLCHRCVRDVATTEGNWVEREHFEARTAELGQFHERLIQMQAALEHEQRPEAKLVSLADLRTELASVTSMAEHKAKKDAPKPKPRAAA